MLSRVGHTPMKAPDLRALQRELREAASPERARISRTFFRTGPGEYGEGDRFQGASVPALRAIARRYQDLSFRDLDRLLMSPIHEKRLIALLILSGRFQRSGPQERARLHRFYLARLSRVNNWDLVDLSAPTLVGEHLAGRELALLTRLARSRDLWRRRVAMVATFGAIRRGDSRPALRIATMLLGDSHDLIHKAAGWMLREVGKRCSLVELRGFLDRHAATMPRTMLRYAIERLPETERKKYMRLRSA
jgi:3-methyladenine DNA glycosylase AlkD